MGKCARDQLFHAIFRDKNTTTKHYIFFPNHRVESTNDLNGLTCILSEELLVNPNCFITGSGIERATMGIWDKDKSTFTDQNELNNQEAMEIMLQVTCIMALDLYQDPQAALKNKMRNFYQADLQKSYAQAQEKYDETVTIASR